MPGPSNPGPGRSIFDSQKPRKPGSSSLSGPRTALPPSQSLVTVGQGMRPNAHFVVSTAPVVASVRQTLVPASQGLAPHHRFAVPAAPVVAPAPQVVALPAPVPTNPELSAMSTAQKASRVKITLCYDANRNDPYSVKEYPNMSTWFRAEHTVPLSNMLAKTYAKFHQQMNDNYGITFGKCLLRVDIYTHGIFRKPRSCKPLIEDENSRVWDIWIHDLNTNQAGELRVILQSVWQTVSGTPCAWSPEARSWLYPWEQKRIAP